MQAVQAGGRAGTTLDAWALVPGGVLRIVSSAMATSMHTGTPFDGAEYISLRSYKRDGAAVDTPVWCAPLDGKLVIFTLKESFKVKRIARNPKVHVAKCDVRGALRGDWHDGTCRSIEGDAAHEQRAYAALVAKYGWKMRIGNFFSTLTRRRGRRLVMEIRLQAD